MWEFPLKDPGGEDPRQNQNFYELPKYEYDHTEFEIISFDSRDSTIHKL